MKLLVNLNERLRDRGFGGRLKSAFRKDQTGENKAVNPMDEKQVEELLASIAERLSEKGRGDKWTWPFKRDDLERDIGRIEAYTDSFVELRVVVSHVVDLQTLSIIKDVRDATKETRSAVDQAALEVRRIARTLDAGRMQLLLEWLSTDDPWAEVLSRLKRIKVSQPSWILETQACQQWMSLDP